MKRLFLLLLLCTSCSIIFAQEKEKENKNLTMRSKFISFENAKISVGWHIEFGGAFFSEDIDNHKGIFNFATGPAFDYYLPFSTVGLSTSVNYKFTEIDFNTDPEAIMATDSLTLGWASVPFFIRFKTGGVSKPFRLVFMPGIEYNYPVYAEIKSNDTPSVRDINILNKHILYYRFQFAGESVFSTQLVVGKEFTARDKGFKYSNRPLNCCESIAYKAFFHLIKQSFPLIIIFIYYLNSFSMY